MGQVEEQDASRATSSSRFASSAVRFRTKATFILFVEINGEKYPQSIALTRHVARQFKLVGKDELEATKCDIIVDTIQDINNAYFRVWFETNDEQQKQKEQASFKTDLLPLKLQGLEKLIKSYGNGTWAVGSDLTWTDLLLHTSIQTLLEVDDQLLEKYPSIKKNREAVEKSPKIAPYLANRKETPF